MSKWVALVVLCLALSLGGSCGGGGGGGGITAALFSGGYCFFLMDLGSGSTILGEAFSDGVSAVTLAGQENDGSIVASWGPEALDYTVDAGGNVSLFSGGLTPTAQGGITSDGRCLALASSDPANPPFLLVFVRIGGALTTAMLNSAYHASWYRISGGSLSSLFSNVTFDGLGGYTGGGTINDGGSASSGSIAGSYTMGTDNVIDYEDFTGTISVGCFLASNDFAALAGGDSTGDDPMLSFLVAAGSGLSASAFSGAYWIAGIEDILSGSGPVSFFGTVNADGIDSVGITAMQNDGMSPTLAAIGGAAGYTVAGDGTLVLNRGGGPGTEDLTGAVSPDGRFAVIAGGGVNGSNPVLFVLLRK